MPSLPDAAAVIKTEPPAETSNTTDHTNMSLNANPSKRIKVDTEDYDDWLSDVIYVGTTSVDKATNVEIINKELEKYDTEPQIVGRSITMVKK